MSVPTAESTSSPTRSCSTPTRPTPSSASSAAVVHLPANDVYALTRYDVIRDALGDPETFSSRTIGFNPMVNEALQGTSLASDPPVHTQLRATLTENLSPRALRGLKDADRRQGRRPWSRELVAQGSFEAIDALARAFPLEVVADLIGFTGHVRDNMLRWGQAAMQVIGPMNQRTAENFPIAGELYGWCSGVTAEDLAPGSVGRGIFDAEARGDIPPNTAGHIIHQYLGAGVDTTVAAIGNIVALFAAHPEQFDLVRKDPLARAGRLRRGAALLGARSTPGAATSPRTWRSTAPRCRPAPRSRILFGAGNRDPRHYENPDAFLVERNPVDHLSFGYGPHGCAGQGLARLEAHAVIEALASRVQRLVVGEEVRVPSNITRSIERAPRPRGGAGMKIAADRARCEGHGLCADTAPEVYDLDDDAVVVLLHEVVPPRAGAQGRGRGAGVPGRRAPGGARDACARSSSSAAPSRRSPRWRCCGWRTSTAGSPCSATRTCRPTPGCRCRRACSPATESIDDVVLAPLADDVDLRLRTPATGLDLRRRTVHTPAGPVRYDGLVIATGGRARRLGRPDQDERVLRSRDDCARLRDDLAAASSVLVVGGGFLGMEIASTARALGKDVTVVDLAPPLDRLLGAVVGGHVRSVGRAGRRPHRRHRRRRPAARHPTPTGVELVDGTRLEADLVVSAVGDVPNVEWLAGSGVQVHGGIVVDRRCRVAPDVVAAGDVTVISRRRRRADPHPRTGPTPSSRPAPRSGRCCTGTRPRRTGRRSTAGPSSSVSTSSWSATSTRRASPPCSTARSTGLRPAGVARRRRPAHRRRGQPPHPTREAQAPAPAGRDRSPRVNTVNTVLGPVPADDLGRRRGPRGAALGRPGRRARLRHHHGPGRDLRDPGREADRLPRAGGGTIVDSTGMFHGRDVQLYEALSRSTGVHIVASTGMGPEENLGGYFLTPQTNPPTPWPAEKFADLFGRGGHRGHGGPARRAPRRRRPGGHHRDPRRA